MPSGTSVSFVETIQQERPIFIVRLERKRDFRLDLNIKSMDRNQGIGVLPRDFVPFQANRIKEAYSYVFVVNMEFKWTQEGLNADPYVDWAEGLFSGLQKRLMVTEHN